MSTCRSCKYLYRYKIVDDQFWHYRCTKNRTNEIDDWKELTIIRKNCGYEEDTYKDPRQIGYKIPESKGSYISGRKKE